MSKKIDTQSVVLDCDSYKVSMVRQYPPGTEYVYSYIASRGGKYNKSFYLGLQRVIRDRIMKKVTREEVLFANEFWTAHGEPFPLEQWLYIVDTHQGILPVEIRGLDEGTLVPSNVPMVTIVNTDPKCFWLTTWLETLLLRSIWYPTTVASNSFYIQQTIKEYLEKSGDVAGLSFKLCDFGSRGVSSNESALIGGFAHMATGAMGTDTAVAVLDAMEFYDAEMIGTGHSIPAAEHSTITSWGRENESKAYENMIDQFSKPGSLYAVVSDSYDIYNAVENIWGNELKDKVISSGGTLIIRPDSGLPDEVLPKLFASAAKSFGYTTNDKGYKVLNNIRFIWGDGINHLSIRTILRVVVDVMGFSADNIAFGQGGALLQIVNRDDLKFAMKCSSVGIRHGFGNLVWRDVFKDPITDPGKKSIAGLVGVNDSLELTTYENNTMLKIRYSNGIEWNPTNLKEIRQRSMNQM